MTALEEVDSRLYDELAESGATVATAQAAVLDRATTKRGGDWLADVPADIPTVWGTSDECLWSEGEPLWICGPPGVGKTTIVGQLVFGRTGLLPTVLGFPVTPDERPVLYLAMDRPKQIRRALGRLYRPEHRGVLNDRLIIREGPLAADVAVRPELLVELADKHGAGTLIVDSVKDAALGLTKDEVGANYNRAQQMVVAAGVEAVNLHHQRKSQNGSKPKALDDVYGSRWLTAGAGSVLMLWGNAGDGIVEMIHLKQPAVAVGPLWVHHDHEAGLSQLEVRFDLLTFLRSLPGSATTAEIAAAKFGRAPSKNEQDSVGRQLRRLASTGSVAQVGERVPTQGQSWVACDTPCDTPVWTG